VIDTWAVADAQESEGQTEGPPSGQAEGQDQGGSEGIAVKNDVDRTKDGRLPWYRVIAAAVLILAAIGLVLWLFVRPPYSFAANASLVLAAAIAFGGGAVCLPLGLRHRLGTFAIVAGTFAGILAAILAIPNRASLPTSTETLGRSPSQSPPPSPSPSELEPFTTNIRFGQVLAPCEGFAVNEKLLRSMPKPKDVNAEWAYGNGGATRFGKMILTIQGRSGSAVVLEAMRIVDFERNPAPVDSVEVIPCFPGGGLQTVRYFEVDLGKRPKVIPRSSDPIPPDDKVQPAVKFPFKVSKSDPEVFEMWVSGPECLCSWRLAIDWTSEGRSGTTIVDRGFEKIKINTEQDLTTYFYDSDAGEWVPPLPR
jgi:hypothetical protein